MSGQNEGTDRRKWLVPKCGAECLIGGEAANKDFNTALCGGYLPSRP